MSEKKRDLLIYDKEYHLWDDEGNYIGVATYTDDENIGDAFISMAVGEDGLTHMVHIPDQWELKTTIE